MQLRMEAVCRHDWPQVEPVSFATYATRVMVGEPLAGSDGPLDALSFSPAPLGMWTTRRYRTLLMGEVPRLTDDENGYGPCGKGLLVHVDIPEDVTAAFERLHETFPDCVRTANPRFASR